MSDDTTDSPPTSAAAADTFVTSLYASFGSKENSADDGMLTSSESHERSSASNMTSLAPGEMQETDWTKDSLGSSLRDPGVTKESSSVTYLLTTTTTTTTANNRTSVFTADNPQTIRLSEADNAPLFAEISVKGLPMSVATDHLPAGVGTQELTSSGIRLTSSSTDNLLTSVSKAGDISPSSDKALNSLLISISGTTDNLLTDLTIAETNDGSTGIPMLSDDQLPTSDILLTSSSTADNPVTPVSKADEFSSSSADDALNSLYISIERSALDTTEESILVRSSLEFKNRLLSATTEGLSSATSENTSPATSEYLLSATSESLSSATSESLQSADREGLPSATSATTEGLSSATTEGLSSATSENLSSATSESLSSSEAEVETLGGTTSGKLDLPPDYNTTSSEGGQSRTPAADAQSSGTRAPRNHVTSPTHVTGNGTAATSFDRGGFHFDEYKNRAPNRNETNSPNTEQSTESKALRISTKDDLFSSSSSSSFTSGGPFVDSNSSSFELSRVSSNNSVQCSVFFGTLFAFVLALLLLNCVVIFLSAKRKDRRYRRPRRPIVSRNISAISFRQISTQVDATVINVIIDEEEDEDEEEWTDDNVDLLTHSPEEIDLSLSLSPSLAAAERVTAEDGCCDVPATGDAGLEPGALEEEEEIGARRSPGAGERQRRRTGESSRNGEAKGARDTGVAAEASGSTRGREFSSTGTRSLPRTALHCTSRPSTEELSNVSTFTRKTTQL